MPEIGLPEAQTSFSERDKKMMELDRRLLDPRTQAQLEKLRPGTNENVDFTISPGQNLAVLRGEQKTKESGWTVDCILSRPGQLTSVALFKISEGESGPKREEKVYTLDQLATINGHLGKSERTNELTVGSPVYVLRTGQIEPESGWEITKFSRNKDNSGMDVLVTNPSLGKEKTVPYPELVRWNS